MIDELIHGTLSGRIDSWHYFWEDEPIKMRHLRLRVLWRRRQGAEGRAALARHLDEAEASGSMWHWYPGSNGVPGEEYGGEAAGYGGPEMWRITYRDWWAGSELALALVKLGTGQCTAEEREFHLQRRVHLHSNRLGLTYLDEGSLYLRLAIGYFSNAGLSNTSDGANVLWTLSHINDVIAAAVAEQGYIANDQPVDGRLSGGELTHQLSANAERVPGMGGCRGLGLVNQLRRSRVPTPTPTSTATS